jgi:NADPH:quinone reductase-like Zn-dependent oxidoreductase
VEISEVRKRVKEAIEHAKRAMADRREIINEGTQEYQVFLDRLATPLFRQIANVLRAEGHLFSVATPSGSVRLISDRSGSDYIELSLDTTGRQAQVVVHASRSRGRRVIESELTLGDGPIRDLTEEEVLTAVMKELEPIVER